jgi:DNA-binding MarR family transcriptional regulator
VALDPAATMRAIDVLEKQGWVQRTPSEEDRRSKRVSLTASGLKARAKFERMFQTLQSAAHGALTSAERKQFCEMAARLTAALEAAGGAASPDEAR